MRETGLPMTSLPPSVFSLGAGVDMTGAVALVVSQSGASDDLVRAARGAKGRAGPPSSPSPTPPAARSRPRPT